MKARDFQEIHSITMSNTIVQRSIIRRWYIKGKPSRNPMRHTIIPMIAQWIKRNIKSQNKLISTLLLLKRTQNTKKWKKINTQNTRKLRLSSTRKLIATTENETRKNFLNKSKIIISELRKTQIEIFVIAINQIIKTNVAYKGN